MWEKHLAECLVHGRSLINVTLSTCHPFAMRFKSDNCIITWKLQSTYILREKEMATHSSILAWRIPWTKEPGGLQSMGSQRVRHDWATHIYTHIHTKSYYFILVLLVGRCAARQEPFNVMGKGGEWSKLLCSKWHNWELHSKIINLFYLKCHRLRNIGWSGHFCVDKRVRNCQDKGAILA